MTDDRGAAEDVTPLEERTNSVPARARSSAAVRPSRPPPMTTTSTSSAMRA